MGIATNRLDGAKRLYQKALTIDSTFCDAWDNLSVCCRRLGDYEGAYWGGIRSIMIDSTNPTGWINCGYALFLEGDMSNALKSFGHLQRIIPENPEGYYGQSLVFYSIDSISQAYKNINRAIENYQIGRIKITPEIKMLEGFIAYKRDNKEYAIKLFKKIYFKQKMNPELNYYMGQYYLSLNDFKKAQKYLGKAKKLGYISESK